MIERKFTVLNSNGEQLVCIEALPIEKPAQPLPVVIMCHGFAYYKEEDGLFTELAKRLVAIGYAVYYFDFSGCGESEGNYEKTSLTKLVGDLQSILGQVLQYSYIDSKNLSLVGQSFGTSVTVAAQLLNVQRIALCGAFFNPHTVIAGIFPKLNIKGVSERVPSEGGLTTIGPQFWQDLKKYQLEELIKNFDCPILFVHGEVDTIVPIENVRPLLKNAHQGQLEVIPESDHGLLPNREQAFQAIVKFFE